jgi:PKD repeat protein
MVALLSAAVCQSADSFLPPLTAPAPQAAPFEARFTTKCTGVLCAFDATASNDGGTAVRWTWDFGEGSIVERTTPVAKKLFPRPGTYEVTLTISDIFGNSSSFSRPDTITAEPLGMTLLAENSFDCIRDCGGGWYFSQDYADGAVVIQDSLAPRSAPGIVQQNFTPQLVGGSSPASIGRTIPNKQVLYTAIWMKMSPTYVGHPSSVNKIIHFYTRGGKNVAIFTLRGIGAAALVPAFGLQQLAAPYRWVSGNTELFETVANLEPNLTACSVQRGQWVRYEMVLTANTPGVSDGKVELWMNGVKCLHYTGIPYVAAGENNKWEELNWSPTYGGGPVALNSTFYTQVDHIYVSGK